MLNASGYVTARRRATISSKITGKVVEVNVEEGMAVREGQVLARLDDANPRAALAFAEAQAEAARRNIAENEVRLADARVSLGRRTQLVKDRVVAQSEVDTAKADVKLDAPKGMAIVGNVLYVADITFVRKFDAKSGKALGEIKIDGA